MKIKMKMERFKPNGVMANRWFVVDDGKSKL